MKAGTASESEISRASRESSGPKMKPKPKAAPATPRPRVRLDASVISLRAALAVAKLAPNKPSTRAREDHHFQRGRQAEHDEADAGGGLAYEQQGLAPAAVGEGAHDRHADHLREGESGQRQADLQRGGAECGGVDMQQRQDDGQAEGINEDQQEDGQHTSPVQRSG